MKKTTYILLIFSALLFTACKKMPDLKVYEIDLNNENVAYSQTSAEITVDYEYPTPLQYVNVTMSGSNYFDYSFVAKAQVKDSMFIANFVDLTTGKTYYYKYEYSNGINVVSSEVKSFYLDAALVTLPTVFTMEVYEVHGNTAIGGGEIIDDGGYMVTARGVCWSKHRNPTIFDQCTTDGMGTGYYSSTMTDLEPNSIYYVRAYAINAKGTSYGTEFSFETYEGGGGENPSYPEGAINGLFSISGNEQVYFSQGNLQYQASTNTWRFAENQWDYVGGTTYDNNSYGTVYANQVQCGNQLMSSSYTGWIDLFAWGTSGYNHGAAIYQPWGQSASASDFYAYGDIAKSLYDDSGIADWGYNAISNGGNIENTWRTLTSQEWRYLLSQRSTSSGIRFAKARVSGVCGLIILPDNWDSGIYSLNNTNQQTAGFNNNIDSAQWYEVFENNGAVFLPCGGSMERYSANNYSYYYGTEGLYFTSSAYTSSSDPSYAGVYIVRFHESDMSNGNSQYENRNFGHSVRLVHK